MSTPEANKLILTQESLPAPTAADPRLVADAPSRRPLEPQLLLGCGNA